MPMVHVRMKNPGEEPGLQEQRHGVRDWLFLAGQWRVMDLTTNEIDFLSTYKNQNGVLLFDVARNRMDAAQIIQERKRRQAAEASKVGLAPFVEVPGIAGTDDDILASVAIQAAAANEKKFAAPRQATIDEEAELADALRIEPESTTVDLDLEEVVARLSAAAGHRVAKAAVKKFGEELATIVLTDPHKLLVIDGVGKKTAKKIIEAFRDVE